MIRSFWWEADFGISLVANLLSMRVHGMRAVINISRRLLLDFLCPVLILGSKWTSTGQKRWIDTLRQQKKRLYSESATSLRLLDSAYLHLWNLPHVCPGCGAYSQHVDSTEAGFYSSHRKSVKNYMAYQGLETPLKESEVFARTSDTEISETRSQSGLESVDVGKPHRIA